MSKPKTEEKLVYSLEDVCRLAKVKAQTIEAWEQELPFLRAGLTGTGKKVFRQRDLLIIQRLKVLLEKKGCTLAGARRQVEEEFALRTPSSLHPDQMKRALLQVRDELQDLLDRLDKSQKKR